MGSQCNSPSTISCQMWPHPWRYRAPWGLGCARGVSGLNAARRNFIWLAKSVCQLLVGAGRVSGQEKIRQERPSAVLFIIALSPATFLPPLGSHFGAHVGHNPEQSLCTCCTGRAGMLTGFPRSQGCPWPLLCMGAPQTRSSETCIYLTGSGMHGEEETRERNSISWSVVRRDPHRIINGSSGQQWHRFHPHCRRCWLQSISRAERSSLLTDA